MRITIIGAGTIGSAVTQDLLQRSEVSQVQVCDARPGALDELEQRLSSPYLRTYRVNARDRQEIEPILSGSSCIVSCVSPDLNLDLARLALKLDIDYCDLGGSDRVVDLQRGLDEEAQKRATWIVPNCGLAPGLVNIVCTHGIEQFDHVHSAKLRVGDIPLEPNPPFNFYLPYAAEKLVEDYNKPVTVIENGELQQRQALEGIEEIEFGDLTLEAFYAAGGLSSLPQDLADRVQTLDYKTIRYPGHAEKMQFLFGLGLAEDQAIDVRTHLTYKDVIVRRFRKVLGEMHPDMVLLRVVITGVIDGRERSLLYEMTDRYSEEQDLTAVKRSTGFPVATIATILAKNMVPGGGVAPPERMIPKDEFFDDLKTRGMNIEMEWSEGHMDVQRPHLRAAETS